MTIEPVKNYKTPAYPTIERYVYSPQEFLRYAPHSWLGNAAVMTALLAFTVGGTNCVYGQTTKPDTEQTDKKPIKNDQTQQEEQQQISFVAPVFVHGDGRGSFGCVVIAPPVILSEEEAMQIIKNEFAKHNIVVDSTKQSITIPVKKLEWVNEKPKFINSKKMEFDGEIKKLNFFIEYVSDYDNDLYEDDDYKINKNGEVEQWFSSVSSTHTKELAEKIREEIKKNNKLNAAIFYDPITKMNYREDLENKNTNKWTDKDWRDYYNKNHKTAIEKSHELLINQVTDFIEWLKKEKLLTE